MSSFPASFEHALTNDHAAPLYSTEYNPDSTEYNPADEYNLANLRRDLADLRFTLFEEMPPFQSTSRSVHEISNCSGATFSTSSFTVGIEEFRCIVPTRLCRACFGRPSSSASAAHSTMTMLHRVLDPASSLAEQVQALYTLRAVARWGKLDPPHLCSDLGTAARTTMAAGMEHLRRLAARPACGPTTLVWIKMRWQPHVRSLLTVEDFLNWVGVAFLEAKNGVMFVCVPSSVITDSVREVFDVGSLIPVLSTDTSDIIEVATCLAQDDTTVTGLTDAALDAALIRHLDAARVICSSTRR